MNIEKKGVLEEIRGNLIVSCQALPGEPLYSSFIMGKMAGAAVEGGARAIRANSVEDILEIQRNVKKLRNAKKCKETKKCKEVFKLKKFQNKS